MKTSSYKKTSETMSTHSKSLQKYTESLPNYSILLQYPRVPMSPHLGNPDYILKGVHVRNRSVPRRLMSWVLTKLSVLRTKLMQFVLEHLF